MVLNKIKTLFIIALLSFSVNAVAQYTQLDGVRICLDAGHGGHDGDDRPTELGIGTTYYESDANWEAVGYLDSLLQKLGATVKNTKTTNDPDSPDRQPSLSDRVQVSNAFNADYFQSFHTNGSSSASSNYTLMLYAGPADGEADYPDALAMAEIMDDELFVYMRTTSTSARADIPFTGYTNGLGVLNNLNMPGTLSECSFHSNLNEGRRLMNSKYRKAAAWAIVKSFIKYYDKPALDVGELGGLVRDINDNALNSIEITLNPNMANEKIYNGDLFLNGFYFFDWLAPGDYEVKFDKFGYDAKIQTVTIQAGLYTEIDVTLTETGGAPAIPSLEYVLNPDGGTGITAGWTANTETTLLGYRLYYALTDDKDNWVLAADENTMDAASTIVTINSSDDFIVVPEGEVYHFKLTAIADSGAESNAGDIYSKSSNVVGDKILIVDGFDRFNGSYTSKYHDFATSYFNAIRVSRYAEVATATNDAVIAGDIDIMDYDMLVWILGDESTADETFNTQEQTLVKAFLDAGGKMLVSGSEIAWDLDNKGTSSDQSFYHNYLKAQYEGDGASDYTPATGISGTGFDDLVIEFGITYPEDFPDAILPLNGSSSIFDYAIEGKVGGVAYKGTFGSGTVEGGIVNASFPLETAADSDQRIMMKKTLDYLEVGGYFPIPPNQPVLFLVGGEGDILKAEWASSTETTLIGYRLYFATDNTLDTWELVADESTLDKNTNSVEINQSQFKVVPAADANHFRLTAISEGGFESEISDVYSKSNADSDIQALVVDGFDRYGGSASYQLNAHNFATNYMIGLQRAGAMNITTIANDRLFDGSFDIGDFNMIYWFLGDESTGTSTFTSNEQEVLKTYLKNGGQLLVTGAEIGWDLYSQGNDTDKSFYRNYLKANYKSDGNSTLSPATGVAGTDFSGLEIEFGIAYPEDFPDVIGSFGGSTEILEYATSGSHAGIAFSGMFDGGLLPGKVIHLSFPLEGAAQDDIDEMLSKSVDYFGVFNASAPIAQNDTATVASNTAISVDVLANDFDNNNDIDPNTIQIMSNPTHGTVQISNQEITYKSDVGYSGIDTFTYTVSDNSSLTSNEAIVEITVEEGMVTDIKDGKAESWDFNIYPNPTANNAKVEITLASHLFGKWVMIIYDIEGKAISQSILNLDKTTQTIDLDIGDLESGLYVVAFSSESHLTTVRILKR